MEENIYKFNVETINGEKISLDSYRGKSLVIVNTASMCGYTPQYTELEEAYQKYKNQNFEIFGFPCNQFGQQEPGTNNDIANFCSTKFSITFPLFAKIEVNGKDAHPLYKYLTKQIPGLLGIEAIKWNFTKFFINSKGIPVKRFAPQDKPLKIMEEMKQHLS